MSVALVDKFPSIILIPLLPFPNEAKSGDEKLKFGFDVSDMAMGSSLQFFINTLFVHVGLEDPSKHIP
jgi:hypothetical protein